MNLAGGVWLVGLLTLPAVSLADPASREVAGVVELGGRTMDYRAWIPAGAAASRKLPMLVGLHGRSRNIERYSFYFLEIGRNAPPGHELVVLSPRIDWDAPWTQTQRLLFAAMDRLAAQAPVDPERVAILGFSMGASSALNLARHNPSRFSSVWAASGRFPDEALRVLRRRTTRVILSYSGGAGQCERTVMLARQIDRGRDIARAIVYPGGGHTPHLEVFREPELLRWFLASR